VAAPAFRDPPPGTKPGSKNATTARRKNQPAAHPHHQKGIVIRDHVHVRHRSIDGAPVFSVSNSGRAGTRVQYGGAVA